MTSDAVGSKDDGSTLFTDGQTGGQFYTDRPTRRVGGCIEFLF